MVEEDEEPDERPVDVGKDSKLDEALDESENFFSEFEAETRRKPKSTEETRKAWTSDEEQEIKALFSKFFDLKNRPTPKDCL